MLRRLGFFLALLAFFSMAGGQWTVLQTVAWTAMLHDYTLRTGSLAVALEQTFDGQHPCELCREILSAKAKEKRGQPASPRASDDAKVKATVATALPLSLIPPAKLLLAPPSDSLFGSSRAEPPPTPPPRCGVVAA